MTKIDFFSMARPPLPTQTRVLIDPRYPDRPVSFTLTGLDTFSQGAVRDLGIKMLRKYVGDETTPPECPFPAVGERSVVFTETMAFIVASLVLMQGANEDAYTFEQLIAFAITMPKAWLELVLFHSELEAATEKVLGEEDAVPTGTHSVSPRNTTPRTRK